MPSCCTGGRPDAGPLRAPFSPLCGGSPPQLPAVAGHSPRGRAPRTRRPAAPVCAPPRARAPDPTPNAWSSVWVCMPCTRTRWGKRPHTFARRGSAWDSPPPHPRPACQRVGPGARTPPLRGPVCGPRHPPLCKKSQCVGVCALARWHRPTRGDPPAPRRGDPPSFAESPRSGVPPRRSLAMIQKAALRSDCAHTKGCAKAQHPLFWLRPLPVGGTPTSKPTCTKPRFAHIFSE